MEFKNVMDAILQYLPVIIAILSEIGVVTTVIKRVSEYFKETKTAVDTLKESTEYTQLKNQMQIVLEENAKLKKNMDILMEKITHVKVTENEQKECK